MSREFLTERLQNFLGRRTERLWRCSHIHLSQSHVPTIGPPRLPVHAVTARLDKRNPYFSSKRRLRINACRLGSTDIDAISGTIAESYRDSRIRQGGSTRRCERLYRFWQNVDHKTSCSPLPSVLGRGAGGEVQGPPSASTHAHHDRGRPRHNPTHLKPPATSRRSADLLEPRQFPGNSFGQRVTAEFAGQHVPGVGFHFEMRLWR